MKLLEWNTDKNYKLKRERGISIEDIVFYIKKGFLLDIIRHPDRNKYPEQKIFIVEIENYVYLIPFIENEKVIFLKTIIPSRKETKRYLRSDLL